MASGKNFALNADPGREKVSFISPFQKGTFYQIGAGNVHIHRLAEKRKRPSYFVAKNNFRYVKAD